MDGHLRIWIKKRARSPGLVVLLALILLALGISQHVALAQEPVRGGTLIEVMSANPPALEAWSVTGVEVSAVSEKIFNKLLGQELIEPRGSEIVATQLAESYDVSPDGTEFTFHLRDNVMWHDGVPFTSADVKYTFEVLLAEYYPRAATLLPNFVGVDTPDDHTAVFTFSKPNPSFLIQLAGPTFIMPKHIYDDPEFPDPTENPANMSPIGTGPFKLDEFVQGDHITLVRNDDYWKEGLPYLDRIIFRIVLDPIAAMNAFEAGDVDFLSYNQLPASEAGRLEQLPGVTLTTRGGESDGQIMFLGMNHDTDRITSDLLVREALWRAIDREDLVERVEFGYARPSHSVIHSENEFYDPALDTNPYPYDVDLANDLLDQAGYSKDEDGIRFSLANVYTTAWSRNELVSEVLTQAFSEIGVTLENFGLDLPAFSERAFQERDFDVIAQFFGVQPDPSVLVSRLYISETLGRAWANAWGYSNSMVDSLFAEGASTFDTDQRLQAFQEVQSVLIDEDIAILPLFEITTPSAYRSDFQNFVTARIAFASRETVWLASLMQEEPTAEIAEPTEAQPTAEIAAPGEAEPTAELAAPREAEPSTSAAWILPVAAVVVVVGAVAIVFLVRRRRIE